jgi:hypothetical protein
MKLSLNDLKSFSINIVDECEIKNNFILLIRDVKISNFLPMKYYCLFNCNIFIGNYIHYTRIIQFLGKNIPIMMSKSLKAEV